MPNTTPGSKGGGKGRQSPTPDPLIHAHRTAIPYRSPESPSTQCEAAGPGPISGCPVSWLVAGDSNAPNALKLAFRLKLMQPIEMRRLRGGDAACQTSQRSRNLFWLESPAPRTWEGPNKPLLFSTIKELPFFGQRVDRPGERGHLFRIAIVAMFVVAFQTYGQPQPSGQELITQVSAATLRATLQAMGFEFTEKQFDASAVFVFQLNGYQVTLVGQDEDLTIFAGFSDKIELSRVNEWNRSYRYSRAYTDEQGGAWIDSDLSCAGGITKGTIEAFIKQFRATLSSYAKFVTEKPPSPPSVSSPSTSAPTPVATRVFPLPLYTRPPNATKRIKTPFGAFALWIDESHWKQGKSYKVGVLDFESIQGEGYGQVVTEEIKVPRTGLRETALSDIQKIDPGARIVLKEERTVNGSQVLALQVDADFERIPVRFFGYCYAGTSGSIRVWTYTAQSAFDRSLAAFSDFLNGLEISEERQQK